jgi:N4-(beta-N-acetylglucosaminyl)-L-asparaginase
MDVLQRVARNFDDDLKRLEAVDLTFYALRKDGQYAGGSLWNHEFGAHGTTQLAIATSDHQGRHENTMYLYERK